MRGEKRTTEDTPRN